MVKDSSGSQSMIDVPPVTALQTNVPCPVCKEPIIGGAKICINCKSDLSWKRYLPIGASTLAMLTALILAMVADGPRVLTSHDVDARGRSQNL
jgi:hypothetical protein